MIEIIFNNQWYILYLAAIMVASAYVQRKGWIFPALNFLSKIIKSNRLFIVIVSSICGVLPIPGRVSVSAGILDTMAPKDERRRWYGIIDYLSTHHYYLWSPLEKSVIVPMAVLGLTYFEFIYIMGPLAIIGIVLPLMLVFYFLKEEDVVWVNPAQQFNKVDWVNWKLLIAVALVIILGNYIKSYTNEIKAYIENNEWSLITGAWVGFAGSFALGSSSRFAAFTAILTSIFGVQYLPLFFAIDYAGYMLSPAHKCFIIGKMYFKTPLITYYTFVIFLCSSIIAIAFLLVR
tara:strand:- start:17389 stop:18258 length:870 start_codon:yes stop_codon:yes gene_type:complete